MSRTLSVTITLTHPGDVEKILAALGLAAANVAPDADLCRALGCPETAARIDDGVAAMRELALRITEQTCNCQALPTVHGPHCDDCSGAPCVCDEVPEGPYGRCDTCGAPCDENGCTVDHKHLIGVDVTNLPSPGPNTVGNLPHAFPVDHQYYSTCAACGAEVFFDGTDDEGTGIWSHIATLDYFC